MSKIFIDAGHGGHDPGAVGKYSKEKDNVLKVAKRLKTFLESHGHTVRLSRSTDVFLSLSERARLANEWGADYFVSLHDNAATSSVSGFETFIHNGPVQSKTAGFQSAIHGAIIKEIGIRDRGEKRANFAVLRETRMPAVLIEYAFISNASDENILINEVEKLAQLTANGIVNYVGGVEQVSPKPIVSQPATNEIAVDGYWGPATTRALQAYFKTPIDGVISGQYSNASTRNIPSVKFGTSGSLLIKVMQRWLGVTADGWLGPITIRALQRKLGTTEDAVISSPSLAIKELQRRLNNGKL